MIRANPVKTIRLAAGLSQIELANKLEITQSAISQFERGKARPQFEVAVRLLKIGAKHKKKMLIEDFYRELALFQPTPKESSHA